MSESVQREGFRFIRCVPLVNWLSLKKARTENKKRKKERNKVRKIQNKRTEKLDTRL